MSDTQREELIYDWNEPYPRIDVEVQFDDETLRDGLQSPSAKDPSLDQKIRLIHLMDDLGIQTADVGLPGAGDRARDHILALVGEMKDLAITPNVACRTVITDIEPVVDMVQQTGSPIEVCAFIGSSPIRQFAEGWDFDKMLDLVKGAITFANDHSLPSMFVTEDTTRAHPDQIRALYTTAIEAGAKRVCVCDTCGHSTPEGTRRVVQFVKGIVEETNPEVGIDWHGHRDRGMGLLNTLAALEAGATRLHATALGIGERTGNTEMDLLLVNLRLNGIIHQDLSKLGEYCRLAAEATGTPFPDNYPVFGSDAFETGTGVHASAVIKALRKGDEWLANRVYSGVPADLFGLEQRIEVGPMSGRSNVQWYLEKRGKTPTDEAVARVLELAKTTPRLLTESEILQAAGI
ncbi:MAG: 2-isopropylmalate synthase [Planctomycetes bacterium]|nr:2-isopropylmalate synthase [Planctomycetota bacterium]MCB9905158.1 2-isopropylmalate synthase [Planctomycetota bacterium]